jgi:ligand-binding sensor domain-containing protein/signal transduction histidine kinase
MFSRIANAVIVPLGALVLLLVVSGVAGAERLPIKIYTAGDGLAHNQVNRIVRDSRGFLWFCTFEGLSRFDGYSFATFGVDQGLPSPAVNDLLETRSGEYWVATAAGLCRFNPKGKPGRRTADLAGQNGAPPSAADAMFEIYLPGGNAGSMHVTRLFEDSRGAIWCGTTSGLYRIERQNGRVILQPVQAATRAGIKEPVWVVSIIEDRKGVLWIGLGIGILRLFADGRVEFYPRGRNGLIDTSIYSLLEDREGRIWAGTEYGGLWRLASDPGPSRPIVERVYTEKDGLPSRLIDQIFQSSDGSLWGAGRGLIQFTPTADGRDFRFHTYDQRHGLNFPGVKVLAEDRSGNLWVGISDSGVAKIARSGITAYGEDDGLAYAKSILRNQAGEIIVAGGTLNSRKHLNRFDGERFNRVELGLPEGVSYSWGWNQLALEDRAGEWWVATDHGIYRFPKVDGFARLARARHKAIYTTRDGLAGDTILRLFEDSRGDIWISAVGGGSSLTRWERATETFHHYTGGDGLPLAPDSYPTSFAEDRRGEVWVGFSYNPNTGVSSGLVRYRDGRFERLTTADGIPEGGIFNLFVDSHGRLWAPATRGGVSRIDNPDAERPTAVKYTTADGLSSNDVRSVAEDRWGRIYFGTTRGIDRLDPATGRIKHYTTADGTLLGNSEAAMADRDGALWFSFPTGVVRLIPEPELLPLPPPVMITGLRVAGEAQPVSALGEVEVAPLELGADRNQLQIDFVALGFGPGEGLRYQYRLEGAAQGWSLPGEQRTVNFANLAPGGYRFLVRAVNADGAMSNVAASFPFSVLPPLWQRWWFVAIMTALVGLAAYALYRYRVARLLEVERLRTRIATDLHDDIGSSLSQIAIMSEVIRQQADAKDHRISRPLSVIAGTSRELVDSMADIVWATDPQRDHLIDLTQRMRQFAGDVLTARNIEFTFAAPGADDNISIETDVRREVFLILKEAINNAVRHSHCSSIRISFRVDDDRLVLEVADDGRGFDATSAGVGHGLASMRRRAESIGGALEIVSGAGHGAAVTLRAPLRRRRLRRLKIAT